MGSLETLNTNADYECEVSLFSLCRDQQARNL